MDEIMDANNEDRRNSTTSISTNPGLQMSSSGTVMKEIQVTAREIVNRISSSSNHQSLSDHNSVFDDKQGKPTGYVKPFTGSDPSGNSSSDEKGDEVKSKEAQSNSSSPPSTSTNYQQSGRPRRLSSKNSNSRLSVSSFTSENGGGSAALEQRAVEHLLDVVQVCR